MFSFVSPKLSGAGTAQSFGHHMKRAFIISLIVLASACALKASRVSELLSDLNSSDRLVIRYTSEGCFHLSDYVFTIKAPTNDSLEVSVARVSDNARGAQEVVGRVGEVVLNNGDKKRFLAFLSLYEGPESELMSSTVETVKVSAERGGKEQSAYEVRRCAMSTNQRSDVVTFEQLVARASAAH